MGADRSRRHVPGVGRTLQLGEFDGQRGDSKSTFLCFRLMSYLCSLPLRGPNVVVLPTCRQSPVSHREVTRSPN